MTSIPGKPVTGCASLSRGHPVLPEPGGPRPEREVMSVAAAAMWLIDQPSVLE